MLYKILNSKFVERTKRKMGRLTGLHVKVKRFTASASEPLRTVLIINNLGIDHVLDVGGNTGQFAESLYDFGYKNKVVSFEPVGVCHEQMLKRSKKYPNWEVAEKMAIGDKDETAMINVTNDTVFSSLLEVKKWHSDLKSTSKMVKKEEVQVHKLDTIVSNYIKDPAASKILLKIDTQGFEKEVLAGAEELLKHVTAIKIEIPLTPIYENVGLGFYETFEFLRENGYKPYSFNNEGVNLKTGRVNTIDGLFVKEK